MSLAITYSRASEGVAAPQVFVETHLTNGLPSLSIVGLPEAAVRESKDRVRGALLNSGFEFPPRRITINLAPADIPKDGGRFDLPIAIGILAASGQISRDALDQYEFAAELAQEAPVAAVDLIVSHCGLNKDDPDSIRFRNMAASAVSLPTFAEHLRRHENSVIYDERAEAVLLATLHAAKGLEFKSVFLTGCEEGLLPLAPRAALDPAAEQEHLAEERRLFFVGLTRAAETLYLCSAGERQGFAGPERQTPSRFLAEIPAELLNSPLLSKKKSKKKCAGKQLMLF